MGDTTTRRRLVAGTGTVGAALVAGCTDVPGGGDDWTDDEEPMGHGSMDEDDTTNDVSMDNDG